jgi:hypothetical protein
LVSSRHEDAVGHAGVQVHVVLERRAEAVEEGDAAEPRTRRTRRVGGLGHACGSAQLPLDLVKEDLRERRDGSGSVGTLAEVPLA